MASHDSLRLLSAEMAACSSMRLLVAAGAPPVNSRRGLLYRNSAAQPPGPGFPSRPPSAWTVIFFQMPLSAMLKACVVRSSRLRNFAQARQHPNGNCSRTFRSAGSAFRSRCAICGVSWGALPPRRYTIPMVQASRPLVSQLSGEREYASSSRKFASISAGAYAGQAP